MAKRLRFFTPNVVLNSQSVRNKVIPVADCVVSEGIDVFIGAHELIPTGYEFNSFTSKSTRLCHKYG